MDNGTEYDLSCKTFFLYGETNRNKTLKFIDRCLWVGVPIFTIIFSRKEYTDGLKRVVYGIRVNTAYKGSWIMELELRK